MFPTQQVAAVASIATTFATSLARFCEKKENIAKLRNSVDGVGEGIGGGGSTVVVGSAA